MSSHEHKPVKKSGGGGMLLTMALGAALATAAGYYATHKEDVDKEAKKRIEQLAKMYRETRPQIEKKVRQIWGDVSDEAVTRYLDLRSYVLHSLEEENLKKTGKALKDSYEKVVEKAVNSAKKAGWLNQNTESKVRDMLKMDWNEIQKVLNAGAKKVVQVAKKAKVKREAKKTVKNVNKAVKKSAGKAKKTVNTAKKAVKKPVAKKSAKRTNKSKRK